MDDKTGAFGVPNEIEKETRVVDFCARREFAWLTPFSSTNIYRSIKYIRLLEVGVEWKLGA